MDLQIVNPDPKYSTVTLMRLSLRSGGPCGGGAGSTHLMCPHCGKRVDLTYRSAYELALDLAVREPPPDEEVRPGDRG